MTGQLFYKGWGEHNQLPSTHKTTTSRLLNTIWIGEARQVKVEHLSKPQAPPPLRRSKKKGLPPNIFVDDFVFLNEQFFKQIIVRQKLFLKFNSSGIC